jgi:hypothetical protein
MDTRARSSSTNWAVEIKHRPIKMGGRTIYRTLLPKRTLFEIGISNDPICERCLEEQELSTHTLCDREAMAYLRFRHLGQFFFFFGTKWLLWRPHIQSPTLHSRFWIDTGLIKVEITIDLQRSRCKGWFCAPPPLMHTYTHPVWWEAVVHIRFRHLDQFFYWPKWQLWRPHR